MQNKGIQVGSVTFAMKGKELLQKNGYRAFITRNPHPRQEEGCGYLIYVNNMDERCIQILKNGGVKVYGTVNLGDSL